MTLKYKADFLSILRALTSHDVKFIVVGGVCGVLQGASLATFDLDVVHSRQAPNLLRLQSALESLEAVYRLAGGRELAPQVSHLESAGHQLLMTKFGPLDLLGSLSGGEDFESLFPYTESVQVADMNVRLLKLEKLIEVKEAVGAEKDKKGLGILRRTLRERSGQREEDSSED